jgi:FRG domain
MTNSENDIRVDSWKDLCDALYIDSWRNDLDRWRSPYVFRGMSNIDYGLTTTLIRLGGNYAELECHLLKSFKKYAEIPGAHRTYSDWQWMTVAQHHGLPSRLLDFSHSPFVALHFATNNMKKFDKDGVVWCVDSGKAHELLPENTRELFHLERVLPIGKVEKAAKDMVEFDSLSDEEFALFFEPPSMDDRIVNQFALFGILSSPSLRLDDWLAEHKNLYKRIIIPREIKWEVRCKLDDANITERMLFSGLDGLAAMLTRYYSPRPKV